MKLNTLKTVIGYFGSHLRSMLPKPLRNSALSAIYNFLPISEHIVTSGQPTAGQFETIRDAGFTHVLNLAPHDASNALPDQSGLLSELGLPYAHIPVDFDNPTEADFSAFCAVMDKHKEENIWVHCAANMRVSAFCYRYRRDVLKEEAASARESLEKIWTPYGVWKQFLMQS